jgi:uncharacterized protein (DUF4213/DUF364 family)
MSTSRVLLDSRASDAARFTVVVVLPTPPFWFAIAITLGTIYILKSIGYITNKLLFPSTTKLRERKEIFNVSRETRELQRKLLCEIRRYQPLPRLRR